MQEAAVWLREAREHGAEPVEVEWRYFSLEQVNSKHGEGWKVWDQPEDEAASLVAFKAAEAARLQGVDAFDRLHHAMLEARHERKETLDRATVMRLAAECGLDAERLDRDIDAPGILAALARDHEGAVAKGVFGTPTIYFGEERGAYLRMMPATTGEHAARVLALFRQTVAGETNIAEIKRP